MSRREELTQRNLEMAEEWLDDLSEWTADDLEAGWRLFSVLAHLERIAVLACEAGGGVEGQLEEERSHEDTFLAIAERLGFEPASVSGPVKELTNFLAALRGPASIIGLNLVAEIWLEHVFKYVGELGPWGPMLALIEAEEARHSRDAAAPEMDPDLVRPIVHSVERLLWRITGDPDFLYPLAHFGDVGGVARMGRKALRAHRRACADLGVGVGLYAKEIALCQHDALGDMAPVVKLANPWENTAISLGIRPIRCGFQARWKGPRDAQWVDAAVVRAVGEVLAKHPQLNRTLHEPRAEIYSVPTPVVGSRRLWDNAGRMVTTVYVRDPGPKHIHCVDRMLRKATARVRGLPYEQVETHREHNLERLAPAPRVAATVTNVTPFGYPANTYGFASLAPREGATWAVCAITFQRRWGRWSLNVSLECDHRVHNGREMGLFARELKLALERGRA